MGIPNIAQGNMDIPIITETEVPEVSPLIRLWFNDITITTAITIITTDLTPIIMITDTEFIQNRPTDTDIITLRETTDDMTIIRGDPIDTMTEMEAHIVGIEEFIAGTEESIAEMEAVGHEYESGLMGRGSNKFSSQLRHIVCGILMI